MIFHYPVIPVFAFNGVGGGGFEVIWVILNVDPGQLVSSEASWPGSTLL